MLRDTGGNGALSHPNVLVLPPPSLYRKLFSPDADARLRQCARRVMFNEAEADWTSRQLAERIGEFDVVVTSWRSPKFTAAVLEAAEGRPLKLVAHSAGSIKFLFDDDDDFLGRSFAVTTAAAAMGQAVGEMALLSTLLLLRPIHQLDAGMKAGTDWRDLKARAPLVQRELTAQRVGVIGAGHTGRHYLRMLRALGVTAVVYDPYLTNGRLAELEVERVESLDELLGTCTVVAMHAPSTPDTRHMLGARELALLPDGAALVNTARASLIDHDALLAELRSGRISAALDVFPEEPLPADSPFRQLPNVILTPHVASHTPQCYHRQGDLTVEEVRRFCQGQPPRYAVTREMLATMA